MCPLTASVGLGGAGGRRLSLPAHSFGWRSLVSPALGHCIDVPEGHSKLEKHVIWKRGRNNKTKPEQDEKDDRLVYSVKKA